MKYKSISLNGSLNGHGYGLLKYEDKYQSYLEELKRVSPKFAASIKEAARIFSELSDHQYYMILEDEKLCIGGVFIGTSCDEENLEIEVSLLENYFENEDDIAQFLDFLGESLKWYFPKMKNLEIRLENGVDLSKYFPLKYRKEVLFKRLTTYFIIYTCSNSRNQRLAFELLNEIQAARKSQYIDESIQGTDLLDFYSFDKEYMEKFENGTLSDSELLYKMKELFLQKKLSNSVMNIRFSREGNVLLEKSSRCNHVSTYTFSYHILEDGFSFTWPYRIGDEPYDNRKGLVEFYSGSFYSAYDCKRKQKILCYETEIVEDSSLLVSLIEKEDALQASIDFRTHKSNGKVNGTYALRIFSDESCEMVSLDFISRKGKWELGFSEDVFGFYDNVCCGENARMWLSSFVARVLPVINEKASLNHRKPISYQHSSVIEDMSKIEKQMIDRLMNIQEELPLPYLSELVNQFLNEQSKNKSENYQRVLK